MLNLSKLNPQNMNNDIQQKDFKPKGAIAFFIVLIALLLVVWFGVYFLMLQRS
jgi:hypothetical protein